MSVIRDRAVSVVPARGGGPWKMYSCAACMPRFWSSSTASHGFASAPAHADQNIWVVRNVAGITGFSSAQYAGLPDRVAAANSMILPRSIRTGNGAPAFPSAAALAMPAPMQWTSSQAAYQALARRASGAFQERSETRRGHAEAHVQDGSAGATGVGDQVHDGPGDVFWLQPRLAHR